MSNQQRKRRQFIENISRGRSFEKKERAEWFDIKEAVASFEVPTRWKGRPGRIDIRIDELGDFISIAEIKATNWDKILPHRIRPTALRHARQLWRYVNKQIEEGVSVCPGLIYEKKPSNLALKTRIEELLNDLMIQVVWRE